MAPRPQQPSTESRPDAPSLLPPTDAKEAAAQPQAPSAKKVDPELVTYLPREGDPAQTKWMGHVFVANVPKSVTNAILIEKARANPWFHVGEFDPQKNGAKVAVNAKSPASSNQYRAHLIAWLKKADSAEDLIQRWAGDATLRETCEVGTDDYEYLGPLIEAKLSELCKIDRLNPSQEAALWVRYGITQIPWRSGEHLARYGLS